MAQQIHVADYQAEGAHAHEVNGAQSRPTAAPPNRWDGRNLGYIPSDPPRLSRAIKLHTDAARLSALGSVRNSSWYRSARRVLSPAPIAAICSATPLLTTS